MRSVLNRFSGGIQRAFFILLCLLVTPAAATHLVGGSLEYKYKGFVSGEHVYQIRLTLYRDCTSGTGFDATIAVGIYNASASTTLSRQDTIVLPKGSEVNVTPPSGGSACTFAPNVCITQCIYQGNISLPSSTTGYFVVWSRCCRTNLLTNLPQDQGQGYFTYIPPTGLQNSSPYFVGVPAPFICTNDLAQVNNAAIDPDGDSLVYSIERPYFGYAGMGSPIWTPPATLAMPIPLVTYSSGFSATQPFGATGTATVNPASGLCNFKAATGNYAVAVEVKEYRNGTLIGLVRRDVMLIVLNCPPNPAANLSSANGSGNTSPSIIAGETTCFPVTFVDSQDSVYVSSFGDILDGTGGYTGTLATLRDTSGFLTATSKFCWTPACSSSRATPYLITVQAVDNGCPAKISTINYEIKVNPFEGIDTIVGDTFICTPLNGKGYSISSPRSGSAYTWTITGGSLVSGQGTSSILVNWPSSSGVGSVSVKETSPQGCVGIPNTRQVLMEKIPVASAITGTPIPCEGDKVATYSVDTGTANLYIWGISGGTITNGNGSASVKVNWGATGSGKIYIVPRSASGCYGDTSFLNITIRPLPTTFAGNDQKTCDPGLPMQLNAAGAVLFKWNSESTLSSLTIPNPVATPLVTTDYVVAGTLVAGGCVVYDTIRITVYSRPLPIAISGDKIPCERTTDVKYRITPRAGSSYKWFASGGSIAGSDTRDSIIVNWSSHGSGMIMMVETNQYGCTGDTNYYPVTIREIPALNAGIDSLICEGETILMNATGANLYNWSPSATLNNLNTANPAANPILSTRYYVKGYLVSGGCEAIDSVDVIVLNKPILNIGEGDSVCEGTTVEVKVLIGTGFRWNTGDTSRSIFVKPSITTAYWVLVQNQKCIFDTLKAFVFIHPRPIASFIPSETEKVEPFTVTFNNTSQKADKYFWSFGNGKVSRDFNPSYTYEFPGHYNVKLKVETNFGCSDSFTFEFIDVLEQKYSMFIPNVITPDGDGLNDFFRLRYGGYTSISGEIFNRWGQKVYTWTGEHWWDGNLRNSESSGAEYYYFIVCEGRHGRRDEFKGSFRIIR